MSEVNAFELLCRPVRRLLEERGFQEPTEPQRRIIPLILEGKNFLLIPATATRKTEAAMLPVMDRFLMSAEKTPGISILYITPSIIKKKYPGTPVIAITGWGEHPGALATEAQADLVLDKPFELMDLERHVVELLATKK